MTAEQRRQIKKLVAITKPNQSVQRRLITYWLKSYMTPYAFSKTFNVNYDRFRKLIEINSSYVKTRIRYMIKATITTLYTANNNRVETLVDISNNRIKSKQDLMQIIQMASAELLEQYKETEDQDTKDKILYKAGNLLKLLENVKDEEFLFIKKLAELYNMDLLQTEEDNETEEQIEIDKNIIKYIEEKKVSEKEKEEKNANE